MTIQSNLEAQRSDLLAKLSSLIDVAEGEKRDLSRREAVRSRELERQIERLDEELEESRIAKANRIRLADEPASERSWLGAEFRALAEGSGSGSYVVPEEYAGSLWDRLAAESVGLQAGFTVISTSTDTLHIPRLSADASAAWTAEAAVITPSDPTFSEVVATPRKLAALVQMSNEIIADANPSVTAIVERNLNRAMALKLDLGFFEGTGTAPEIRGLKNVSGIGTVSMGTNGLAPTNLDPIADAIGTLEMANASATAIVMHPRTWGTLSKLKEAPTGNNKPLLQEVGGGGNAIDRRLYGVPVYLTSQISITETQGAASTASSIYVFQAREIVAVRREDVRVDLDPYRLFNSDQTEIRAVSRWDMVVPNPSAVVRIAGLLP